MQRREEAIRRGVSSDWRRGVERVLNGSGTSRCVHHSTSTRCPAHLLFTQNPSSSAAVKANMVERQYCAGSERIVLSPLH